MLIKDFCFLTTTRWRYFMYHTCIWLNILPIFVFIFARYFTNDINLVSHRFNTPTPLAGLTSADSKCCLFGSSAPFGCFVVDMLSIYSSHKILNYLSAFVFHVQVCCKFILWYFRYTCILSGTTLHILTKSTSLCLPKSLKAPTIC